MTSVAQEETSEKVCPKCQSLIAAKATVCPVCYSDIADRKKNTLAGTARFIRDWVGFPAALVAATVGAYNPAKNAINEFFEWDYPVLEIKYLKLGVLNYGSSDYKPIFEQPNEIYEYIPYVSYLMINKGLTPATIQTEFSCSRVEPSPETSRFYFMDLKTGQRISEDPKLGPDESIIVNVVAKDHYSDASLTLSNPQPCQLTYTDKYADKFGPKTVDLPQPATTSVPSLFDLESFEDRRVALREKYCPNMSRGMRLGGQPVDCIDDKHIIAIEPIYLWQDALERALKQASEFHQLTQSTASRVPGLVLTGCDEPNCAEKTQEMQHSLRSFTPSVTVWLCPPDRESGSTNGAIDLDKVCKLTTYPEAAP